jgi:hypothetical protein
MFISMFISFSLVNCEPNKKCSPGYYFSRSNCLLCPPGYYCSGDGDANVCPSNTYGVTGSSSCLSCDSSCINGCDSTTGECTSCRFLQYRTGTKCISLFPILGSIISNLICPLRAVFSDPCCPANQVSINGECCPLQQQNLFSNPVGCCSNNTLPVATGECCGLNSFYLSANGVTSCCAPGQFFSNGKCCATGYYNSSGLCCAIGTYNSQDVCCPLGQVSTAARICACPHGTFLNGSTCIPCDNSCLTCDPISGLCTSCDTPLSITGNLCCGGGRVNINGKCQCAPETSSVNGSCCANTSITNVNGSCCPIDTTPINGGCCLNSQINNGICCPMGTQPTGSTCCLPSQGISGNNQCCSISPISTVTPCNCGAGYYSNGTSCMTCSISHCSTCTNANTCTKCKGTTVLDPTSSTCVCPGGQSPDKNGICCYDVLLNKDDICCGQNAIQVINGTQCLCPSQLVATNTSCV